MQTNTYHYRISDVKPLTDTIIQIRASATESLMPYLAGQYIEIDNGEEQRPYSIANAPLGGPLIEIHLRHTAQNTYTQKLLENIRRTGLLHFNGPMGKCVLSKHEGPIIFFAGGTGFAPMKAIIEEALAQGLKQPMHLYWGARQMSDLYLHHLPHDWAESVSHFAYTPVLSQPSPRWQGAVGNLCDEVLATYPDLSTHQVYAGGPPEFVVNAKSRFLAAGLQPNYICSDVLD